MKDPILFQGEIIYKIAKILWRNLKIISKTTGPISTKPATMHPWTKGIEICSNEELFNCHKVDNGVFLLLINIVIIICVYWCEHFSHVSDVAHGPLHNFHRYWDLSAVSWWWAYQPCQQLNPYDNRYYWILIIRIDVNKNSNIHMMRWYWNSTENCYSKLK